ncbi:hypothetical protein [Helicobacter sp. 11S02629-2]|uniref:hypothetical protein n=1 Tax=Helicobacter sp. 11S02629-2 TaxID=1476195 RepID=UPI000BA4F035|nr:hypothetical protein [Helicobacter sp. 11S02629-2]PAF45440.1 hypothetical protein BKH40_02945 [Helicobacter sp. 11S02629-2]
MIKKSLLCIALLLVLTKLGAAPFDIGLKPSPSTASSDTSSKPASPKDSIDLDTPASSNLLESSKPLKDSKALESSKPLKADSIDSTKTQPILDNSSNYDDITQPSITNLKPRSIIQNVNQNLSKAFMQEANPYNIDYDNLDPKYYKYIRYYAKYYDSDIARLITAVDAGELKSGFFVGGNLNLKANKPLNAGLELVAGFVNLKGGGRLGLFTPNGPVGYRLYINYVQNFGAGYISYFGGNADLLVHLPFAYKKEQGIELALGLGLGNMLASSTKDSSFKLGGSINLGLIYVFKKQRIELGTKVLAPINLTNFSTYFIVPSLGYSYVF